MKHRKLRIAWSVGWGLVVVLLCALWVRSYWKNDWLGGLLMSPTSATGELHATDGCLFDSANGVVAVIYIGNLRVSLQNLTSAGTWSANDETRVTGYQDVSIWNGFRAQINASSSFSGSIPHWFLMMVSAAIAFAPWLRWRFSLRTLLIATTLVAVVLSLIVWAGR